MNWPSQTARMFIEASSFGSGTGYTTTPGPASPKARGARRAPPEERQPTDGCASSVSVARRGGAVPTLPVPRDVEQDHARFEPTAAPAIVVISASMSAAALKPSQAADEGAADRGREADRLRPGRPVTADPGEVDAEPDRGADRERGEQLAVDRDARVVEITIEDAEEPAAEAEDDRVHRPQEHGAGLAAEASPLV